MVVDDVTADVVVMVDDVVAAVVVFVVVVVVVVAVVVVAVDVEIKLSYISLLFVSRLSKGI